MAKPNYKFEKRKKELAKKKKKDEKMKRKEAKKLGLFDENGEPLEDEDQPEQL